MINVVSILKILIQLKLICKYKIYYILSLYHSYSYYIIFDFIHRRKTSYTETTSNHNKFNKAIDIIAQLANKKKLSNHNRKMTIDIESNQTNSNINTNSISDIVSDSIISDTSTSNKCSTTINNTSKNISYNNFVNFNGFPLNCIPNINSNSNFININDTNNTNINNSIKYGVAYIPIPCKLLFNINIHYFFV